MTQTVLLGDIATIHDNKRIPLNSRQRAERPGNVPYYGATGIVDYIDEPLFDGEYVLIGEDGENLRSKKADLAFKVSGKFWVNNHAHVIKGNEQWINDYIVNAFRVLDISQYITGAAQPKLNQAALMRIPIPWSGNVESKKITKILSTIDEKIGLNRKINETLEQMGQALFRHYFITNPDAVGWRKRELGEFFPIKTGKKDANFGTEDGEYPFFTCAQTISKAPDYSFDAHALLLAGNGDFNLKLYRGKFEAYQRTYVLVPTNEKFVGLLYFLMKMKLPEITGGSRGSVIKFITKGMIENYKFALPNDEELVNFSDQLNQITVNIEQNVKQIQTLTALRDSLLPHLISGKIKT